MRNYRLLYFLYVCLILTVSCTNHSETILKHTFFRMDTIIEVVLTSQKSFRPDSVWLSIDSILKDWEERFSISNGKSEIKRINERTNDTVPISKDLGEMIQFALNYGDTLSGSFDFTILPLKEIWGLSEDSPENAPVPTMRQIDSVCSLIDYREVSINSTHDTLFFLSPLTKVDIGGVAKAFAMKRVETLLIKRGINNYLVNAGGDIIGRGKKPDGSSWTIGIQNPRESDKVLATFHLDKGSVFTSGDYERFRMIDGKRVHHIFNPHTGFSCTGNQSVTIYGSDPVKNKFLSTGLFCRSADSIIAFVSKYSEIECLVVDSSGKVYISNRWKDKLELVENDR